MMNITNLPETVLNIVLYEYLPSEDILNCRLAHRCFDVLSGYQKSVLIYASRGLPNCFVQIQGIPQPDSLSIVKRMYINDPRLNTYTRKYEFIHLHGYYSLFELSCRIGWLDLAKWLVSVLQIDIHAGNEYVFELSCEYGQLEVAKWLFQYAEDTGSRINIHATNEYAFRWSCENGYIDVAKWLIELSKKINSPINISTISEYTFRWSCKNKHTEIGKWLIELCEKSSCPINKSLVEHYMGC